MAKLITIDSLQTFTNKIKELLDGKSDAGHTHTISEVTNAGDLASKNTNGSTSNFLRGDGTWVTPNGTTYQDATATSHGLMTGAMVTKLDGIQAGANLYSLPTATSSTFGGVKTGGNITNTNGLIDITKSNVINALGYTPTSSSGGDLEAITNDEIDELFK